MKMTYAPIWADAKVSISDSSVTMHVTNRYSFTDLSEMKTTWKLLNADKKVGKTWDSEGFIAGSVADGEM